MPMFAHQQATYDATKDLEYFAYLWEMRCGKTLPIINTMVHWYELAKMDFVLVLAPSGVHLNWSRIQLPMHRPKDCIIEWDGGKANNKGFQKLLGNVIADKTNLAWLCMNREALLTESGQEAIANILEERHCGLVCDESDIFKNPKARSTKYILKHAQDFRPRRTATGTSAPQGPFDLWSQFNILHPDILGNKFLPFKQRYGIFKRVRYGGPAFDQLVAYRDLDQLQERIAKFSSRLTQVEVYDNLPEKMPPEMRLFKMNKEQSAAYEEMRVQMMVALESGEIVNAPQALVWLLRLQQISRGFLPKEDGTMHPLGSEAPIEALLQTLKQMEGKSIIWCRFHEDVDNVVRALTEAGKKVVRHDGRMSKDERADARVLFKSDPSVTEFVGTPGTGGIGVDLSEAQNSIFYSHSYDLRERLQAIARPEGPNQKADKLFIVDIVAADTRDMDLLSKLEKKEDLMATVNGDKIRQLLGT